VETNASTFVRRLLLAAAAAPAAVLLVAAGPAFADTPENWETADPISPLSWLLVLVVIPLALVVVISLAVLIPSMARGEKYTPGLAWRSQSRWFGGPRGGVEAVDNVPPPAVEDVDPGRGGASARW